MTGDKIFDDAYVFGTATTAPLTKSELLRKPIPEAGFEMYATSKPYRVIIRAELIRDEPD